MCVLPLDASNKQSSGQLMNDGAEEVVGVGLGLLAHRSSLERMVTTLVLSGSFGPQGNQWQGKAKTPKARIRPQFSSPLAVLPILCLCLFTHYESHNPISHIT